MTGDAQESLAETCMLSVVIPAYNEEDRLPASLARVAEYLDSLGSPCEAIVVDDGSTDSTARCVEEFAAAHANVRLLRHERNFGKGRAVQTGMLSARGKYAIFCDADLSTPIDTADSFLEILSNGGDVVVGNRRMKESTLEVRQARLREFLGRIFTRLTRFMLKSPVTDQTCGFKGFKIAAAREVFLRQRIPDWSFDAEILHIAARRGLAVKQTPVRWHDEPGSKVHVLTAGLRSLVSLFAIWHNGLRGRYN